MVVGEMCSSSTQLRWLSMHVLSCKSCLEDGGVESIETLHFSWSKGAPSSTTLLISFCFIDFALSSQMTRKRNKNHSSELIHAWYWWTLLGCKANTWYEDRICTKNRTAWHIHTYLCKLSRSHFNKLEATQGRHHMKDATNMTLPS